MSALLIDLTLQEMSGYGKYNNAQLGHGGKILICMMLAQTMCIGAVRPLGPHVPQKVAGTISAGSGARVRSDASGWSSKGRDRTVFRRWNSA